MAKTRLRISVSGEHRVMASLLVFVALGILAPHVGWPQPLQFVLTVLAVVPLAAFIGAATEGLAGQLGGKVGGLLNATFGNAPDLLVGVFGVQRGLIPLVKATLIGALISNSALIMGLCCMVAGLIHGRPRFKREEAGHHSVLMMLTVAAVLFPSVGAIVVCGGTSCAATSTRDTLQHVSVGISIALLVAYVAYVLYGIFGLESLHERKQEGRETHHVTHARKEQVDSEHWPTWLNLSVLVGSTLALIPITDTLTGTVQSITTHLGWSEVFVGMIVVANAGNVAEAYAAIKFAVTHAGSPEDSPTGDSGLDLSLGIASASSIQIATFVAPLVVLYSLTGHHMNLVFSPIEISILALLVIIFTYIAQDGESNWLEGVQLIVLYVMAAVVFFSFPASAFGG
jgi:Ca2+:H+ antiporter